MRTWPIWRCVWPLLLCGWLLQGAPARAADSPHLVSVAWLQQHIGRGDVLLIDASPGPLHAAQHIPGAVHADLMNFGIREQSNAAMQQRLRSWGVSAGKKIVFYDGDGQQWAARLFFELYQLGYPAEDLALLDGGLAHWVASGGAVTKAATPAPAPGSFSVTRTRDEVVARLPEFLAATGEPQRTAVVEALTPEYYYGGKKFFDRGGHVPNALLLPRDDFFNADKTFKSPEQMRQMLAHIGLPAERPVISYCGGGVAAAVPFFAMKFLLGRSEVKLFRGSQLEWLRDQRGLPMWSYSTPNLLRSADWLASWGSGFLHAMGISRLQVVDVRAPAAFAQGHLPGAVNLPAAALRQQGLSAQTLPALLKRADATGELEVVVISERGGINPDSALAFMLLERARGGRVSLWGGSVDEWALRGLPLEKSAAASAATPSAAIAIGADSTPRGASADSAGSVVIASGTTLPQRVPAGRVIHLPYTAFLDRDGQPKPAGEIWALLEKAGVPRYQPLVLTADDAGEAAANYVVLRLMGFTNLSVQAL